MNNGGKRRWAACLLLLLTIVLQTAGCQGMMQSGGTGSQGEIHVPAEGETLEIHFLDVGQGDATLIRQGSHAMLIDGGDNDKGTLVQSYLKYQGIEELDYVIGTHPDSDHVGGLDVVMYKFPWDEVILPDLQKDTKTYQDVLKVIKEKGKNITYPIVGTTYKLGEAEFTVIAPAEEDYGDNWNDYSVGILLCFGENRFVFTGDAEEEAEEDMIETAGDLSADVLKAAHHGSDTANTSSFLEAVNPESVVISCGEGNSYGHPRAGAMNRFREMGVDVYRTDEQGTIVAVSDGKKITWSCSPSESWQAGEPSGGQSGKEREGNVTENQNSGSGGLGNQNTETEKSENQEEYVINSNTRKFHKASCGSVGQMQEENRVYSSQSRQELIEGGYEPCQRCRP